MNLDKGFFWAIIINIKGGFAGVKLSIKVKEGYEG